MAGAGALWQLGLDKMEQRCGYLLRSKQWSDCTFKVGTETNQEVVQAHKLVLAMTSPVFEAMFYGGLSERNDPIVTITDVLPEAFKGLLEYIYTGHLQMGSLDMALSLWYGARKYMLPHLEKQCSSYICSVVGSSNACQIYEIACLLSDNTVIEKCIQIISLRTKKVLKNSSFVDMQPATLITVCSLDHPNVDSELDLFHGVARYAEEKQRRQGLIDPPVGGEPPSKKLCKSLQHSSTFEEKEFPSVESSSDTSPSAELSKPPTVVATSEEENLKEEAPSIRAALQKIRFLSMTAAEFAEGPARSGLLTKEETDAVLTNIISKDSAVPMPTGFSECRERRVSHNDLEMVAAQAADEVMWSPLDVQSALDRGILDALVPALTEGSDACKVLAADAIRNLCRSASPAQLRVVAASAALQPYCRLLPAGGYASCWVLLGLTNLLQRGGRKSRTALVQQLRALGVPQLLMTVLERGDRWWNHKQANYLLQTFFNNNLYVL